MSEPSGSQAPDTEAKDEAAETTRVAFRFHPRALAALGRDLVTSDVVAVMVAGQERVRRDGDQGRGAYPLWG